MNQEIDYNNLLSTMNLCVNNGKLCKINKQKKEKTFWTDPDDLPIEIKQSIIQKEVKRANLKHQMNIRNKYRNALVFQHSKQMSGKIKFINNTPSSLYELDPRSVETIFPMHK